MWIEKLVIPSPLKSEIGSLQETLKPYDLLNKTWSINNKSTL